MNTGAIVFAFLAAVVLIIGAGVHQVPEGYVGLYYFGGALQTYTSQPGYSWAPPFAFKYIAVQTTLQTDAVLNIPCGTSSGVMIYFDRIEVVNKLASDKAYSTIKRFGELYDKSFIYDKIHHEINQFCSSHSLQEVYIDKFSTLDESLAEALQKSCDKYDTGVEIVAIRVTKPRIPETVRKNYEKAEEAKTQLQIAKQEALVAQTRAETERMKMVVASRRDAEIAVITAEKSANVSAIRTNAEILVKEGEKKKALIDNDITLARERAAADAKYYQLEREAKGNELRLTPAFLKLTLFESLAKNSKIFFGESIPKIFTAWSKQQLQELTEETSAE